MAYKLLLADDSVTIQRVIELTFADEDVEVTAVGDGQLAIERLDAERFDIVLADVDMPKRDGYDVAAYVKSRPKLAHIPVVLLTGAFEPIDQARADAAGSSDVLAKPFEPQMVINRVKQLLGKNNEDAGEEAPREQPHAFAPKPSAPTAPTASGPQSAGQASQSISLDDYFDQLDAAFSSLKPEAPAAEHDLGSSNRIEWPEMEPAVAPPVATAPVAVPPPPVQPVQRAAPAVAPVRPVRAVPPPAPVVGVPEHLPPAAAPPPPPAPVAAPPAPRPVAAPPIVTPYVPPPAAVVAPPPAPAVLPAPAPAPAPIAAAKPAAPAPSNPFASLSAAKAEAAARPPAPAVTEEMIEEIVTRVLQRMSDRVVRETVTDIVAKIAERAVQEEIEKIKEQS